MLWGWRWKGYGKLRLVTSNPEQIRDYGVSDIHQYSNISTAKTLKINTSNEFIMLGFIMLNFEKMHSSLVSPQTFLWERSVHWIAAQINGLISIW